MSSSVQDSAFTFLAEHTTKNQQEMEKKKTDELITSQEITKVGSMIFADQEKKILISQVLEGLKLLH